VSFSLLSEVQRAPKGTPLRSLLAAALPDSLFEHPILLASYTSLAHGALQ